VALDWRTPERARDALETTIIAPDPAITGRAGGAIDDATAEAEPFLPDAEESAAAPRLPAFIRRRPTPP
jgi:hypothetical protein